jgi:hypothetical protein
MFENRVLRKIFGPKREQVTGHWRRLHNEELHVMYSSSNVIPVIKLETIRWAGHVARMGRGEVLTGRNPGERNHLEDLGVDDRIIIKRIFEKFHRRTEWIDLAQDRSRGRDVVNAVMILRVP